MSLLDGKPLEDVRRRPPDPLWDVLLEVCGVDTSQIPKSARGAYNRACGDLRAMKVSGDDIRDHAEVFRTLWPGVTMTPTALVRRWAETMPRKKPAMKAKVVRVECERCVHGWIELPDGTVQRCHH